MNLQSTFLILDFVDISLLQCPGHGNMKLHSRPSQFTPRRSVCPLIVYHFSYFFGNGNAQICSGVLGGAGWCWVVLAVTGPGYKLRVNLQATLSRHKDISLGSSVGRYHRHHVGAQGAMFRGVQTVFKAPGFLGRMLDSYDI